MERRELLLSPPFDAGNGRRGAREGAETGARHTMPAPLTLGGVSSWAG